MDALPPTAGRTVVVTGGAGGLSYAIAERFLDRGANVLINGRDVAKLAQAAARLGRPSRLATVTADITQPASAELTVGAAVQRFGRVDVLVNNAGIFQSKPFTDYTVEELDGFLAYLRGTFVLTQAVVRRMRSQGDGGSIIHIGTILALGGVAGLPSSAPVAAKGGITALTRNLAVELAADNIRVNAVAPGLVPTPPYGELNAEQAEALHERQPLGRYGTPNDVADAVLYLADAGWVTGVILPVDGGTAAGGDAASRRPRAAPRAHRASRVEAGVEP